MGWALDFCLSCDKQISEGVYCSQTCRLADLERAGSSEMASPHSLLSSASISESWAPSTLGTGSGFYLPPRLDFDSYKLSTASSPGTTSPLASPRTDTLFLPAAFTKPSTLSSSHSRAPSQPGLTTSSSRSSLSSAAIVFTERKGSLSEKSQQELRGYANAFDQAREDRQKRLSLP